MPQITIRQAELKDLATIQKLSYALFQYEQPRGDPAIDMGWTYGPQGTAFFTQRLTGEYGVCYIAEYQGEAAGYLAGAMMQGDYSYRPVVRAELENMFVTERYHGQGVGRALAERFKEWSLAHGAQRIAVSAYALNEDAVRFYESLGGNKLSVEVEICL